MPQRAASAFLGRLFPAASIRIPRTSFLSSRPRLHDPPFSLPACPPPPRKAAGLRLTCSAGVTTMSSTTCHTVLTSPLASLAAACTQNTQCRHTHMLITTCKKSTTCVCQHEPGRDQPKPSTDFGSIHTAFTNALRLQRKPPHCCCCRCRCWWCCPISHFLPFYLCSRVAPGAPLKRLLQQVVEGQAEPTATTHTPHSRALGGRGQVGGGQDVVAPVAQVGGAWGEQSTCREVKEGGQAGGCTTSAQAHMNTHEQTYKHTRRQGIQRHKMWHYGYAT